MGTLAFPFEVRDSANSTTDNRKTGLAPVVSAGRTIAASPATVDPSAVSVVEIVAGHYAALYDPEAHGDASFPVDCGAGLANPNDRYLTLALTRDSGRLLAGFDANGEAALRPAGLDRIAAAEPTVQANGAMSTWKFPQLLRWVVMRLARASKTSGTLTVYTLAGVQSTAQAVADDGAGDESTGVPS